MTCPWSCACDPPTPLIKVASNTRPYSKLGGTPLNGREEGGGRSVLYLTDLWPGAIWSKKGRFSWECLNIFAIGCSYSMHCSWWQAVKMTFFAHCPSVSLSAGMSALTWLPTTHCNQFFFVYFILFFPSLHSWSVFKNSRLWTEKVLTIWLEYVSIININQFWLIGLHQYI